MPEIIPFNGILYSPELLKSASELICPPYDVISAAFQQRLYGSSPYNAIRLELPLEADPYSAAAERLAEWLQGGELQNDSVPAIYPYFQTFEDSDGVSHTRCGFFAAMRLYDFSEKKVLPHEKTLSGPKADRLNLFRKTKTNISGIFGLYADESKTADCLMKAFTESHEPIVDAHFEGVSNRLWRITDPEIVGQFQQSLQDRAVYIADGHHRYDTGVNYRNERAAANPSHTGQEPYNFILTYLANIHDEGLLIFPIHRLVHSLEGFDAALLKSRLAEFFTVTELHDRAALKAFLDGEPSSYAYGVVTSGMVLGICLKTDPKPLLDPARPEALQRLGLVLLHDLILFRLLGISQEAMAKQSNLTYVKDDREVFDAIDSGKVQVGFVVKPTTVEQVLSVSETGEVMPQKSTFFYPKLMTGMLFNPLD
ncbi:DUF1015 domain-containing protein [Pelodictyon phaeoclathratiforme]|jgi:uncharacterized protein (DUF1015 family)|uniref:DUF1015 domain-containing protein n=1 Tax=Pelodictyon phaeoclathratiforme (strain DSM 5477 / BU-1) TaxID=324925 RepID=B4SAS6_PELPB|nr:DUF1015 domain-containing protein [Pelodictyon phaeoclathratiforme]ACF42445.1 conserved hypothetical protein [Pelodictyon phaeoclathratiforme BU-1]MBV5288874.1 DUF1015 domain-containing protein [Pelodictyon phaeoclathratiforme]